MDAVGGALFRPRSSCCPLTAGPRAGLAAAGAITCAMIISGRPRLGSFYVGYALLIWPTTDSIGAAFRSVGPALWTFGSPDMHGFFETAVLDTAAMAGLVTVTLQIAYLPALYAAFNRRETRSRC